MVKTFQAYLPSECHRTYSCVHCRAHLANHDELISKVCFSTLFCLSLCVSVPVCMCACVCVYQTCIFPFSRLIPSSRTRTKTRLRYPMTKTLTERPNAEIFPAGVSCVFEPLLIACIIPWHWQWHRTNHDVTMNTELKHLNRACKLFNIRLCATLCFNYFRWHRRMFSYGSVLKSLSC